jgi:hypothetical protein
LAAFYAYIAPIDVFGRTFWLSVWLCLAHDLTFSPKNRKPGAGAAMSRLAPSM